MKVLKFLPTVVTILAVLLVLFSGIMKFVGSKEVVTTLEKAGVPGYRYLLGTMEIVFALLFLFKPTMKIGFILVACYFAGALATELSHGMPFNAVLPMTLVCLAAFLRDKNIFLPGRSSQTPTKIAL